MHPACRLQQVFESVGDQIDFDKGSVVGNPEAMNRLRTRAGIVADLRPRVPTAPRRDYFDRVKC
jgi:hypothetical protein